MSDEPTGPPGDLLAAARARVARIDQAAGDLAEELGLPPAAKYLLASAMVGATSPSTVEANAAAPDLGADARARAFQLTERFVTRYLRTQLGAFQALRERLGQIPLEALAEGPRSATSPALGLGFAPQAHELLAVLSAVAWYTGNAAANEAQIYAAATARGCPPQLALTLARYLRAALTA